MAFTIFLPHGWLWKYGSLIICLFAVYEQFNDKLKQVGDKSLWFVMIILFASLPNVCYVILNTSYEKFDDCNTSIRCRIPELENKHWTFEQINYLSAPMDKDERIRNCSYYMYDYSKIAKMNYTTALTFIENADLPNISFCKDFVYEGCDRHTLAGELTLTCKLPLYEKALMISPTYGQVIADLFIVPFGDLFGRRRLISWGVDLFLAGGCIMCLGRKAEGVILGRFLTGIAYTTMIRPIESIVIEISNIQLLPLRFIAMSLGNGFGLMAVPVLGTNVWYWRHLQWAVCSTLLVLPLTAWFVPESPRWLLSKNRKAKAWAILRTIKQPALQSELLLIFRNHRSTDVEATQMHLAEFKPFAIAKLWFLTLLLFLVGCVYFNNHSIHFQEKLYVARSTYLVLSGAAEICGCILCMPMLVMLRKSIIFGVLFLCTSVTYFITSSLEEGTLNSLILLLITSGLTRPLYAIAYLYVGESIPTTHRCTAFGITSGLGADLAAVILFHSYQYFINNEIACIIFGCFCLTGFIMSLFAQEPRQESLYDTIEETTRAHLN